VGGLTMSSLAGIVLCGGRSRRMGRPKAWLPFAGTTLLGHVAGTLAGVAEPVVVVAAAGQDLPPLPPGVVVMRDPAPDRGPLEGLAAGLAAVAGRAPAAFATSCDAPFLRPALVRRLLDLLGDNAACVPHVEGRYHPLTAVYRADVLPAVRRLLDAGRRRLLDLLDAVPVRAASADELAAADPDLVSLRNLNTPDEYEAALRAVAADRPGT
jgi:molybdenum cofactor guanylyltransferase